MLQAIVVLATEAAGEQHADHTAFYVLGLVLAAWAVIVSAIGIRRAEHFPPRGPARTGIVAVSALLVLGTAASAVLTA